MDNLDELLANIEIGDTEYLDEYDIQLEKDRSSRRTKSSIKVDDTKYGKWEFDLSYIGKFDVHVYKHDIKYGDQRWDVPEHDVTYEIRQVASKPVAMSIATVLKDYCNDKDIVEKTRTGEYRWLQIVAANEGVQNDCRNLANIKLRVQDNKIAYSVFFVNKAIEELKAKDDRLKEQIKGEIYNYIQHIYDIASF